MDNGFWARVDIRGEDECWPWTRTPSQKYGKYNLMTDDGWKLVSAHRMAYELANGSIPNGMYVCHSCDNPRCCNPAHLWTGTNSDNQIDSVAKGRFRGGPPISRCGTEHHSNKLSEAQVFDIRREFDSGASQRDLVAKYGVNKSMIHKIVRRLSWKHL